MTQDDATTATEGPDGGVPDNPRHHPAQTVDALEGKVEGKAEGKAAGGGGEDRDPVPAEDVTENPGTDELEGLPGPSPDQPGEPAG